MDSNNRLQAVHSGCTIHGQMDNLSDLLQQDSVSESGHQVATGGSVIERLLQQKQGLQEHVISRYIYICYLQVYVYVCVYI